MPSRVHVFALGVAALLAAAGSDCATSTAIVVDVVSEVPCTADAQVVVVGGATLGELPSRAPATSATVCEPDPGGGFRRGRVVLVPAKDASEAIAFAVMTRADSAAPDACLTGGGAQCIVAKRQLRFSPRTELRMRVDLRQACAGVSCAGEQTCVRGACVDANVDPKMCVMGCDETSTGQNPQAASRYAAAVLADGPAAYWRFEETAGPLARDEISGQTGTWEGTCGFRTPGAIAGSAGVQLDDTTCWLDLGDTFAFPGNAPYTLEVWVKPLGDLTQVRRVLSRNTLMDPSEGYELYYGKDFALFSRSAAGMETAYATQTSAPVLGAFVHLVATYDGDRTHLFADGREVATSSPGQPPIGSGPGRLALGQMARGIYFKLNGVVDELAIYATALPADRVAAHFAAAR